MKLKEGIYFLNNHGRQFNSIKYFKGFHLVNLIKDIEQECCKVIGLRFNGDYVIELLIRDHKIKTFHCIICDKILKSNKVFCSRKCRDKAEYSTNKKILLSRSKTYALIQREPELLKKKCLLCKNQVGLEIHHEIYPFDVKDIKTAICEGRIYYVCKKHHTQLGLLNQKLKEK